MKPLAPNTLLQNRYLLVQLIGKGGMGEVYLAVDQRLGSAIALKRTFFNEDEMLGSAFEREARTLARLRHPVLPKVSDHFAEGENQFLVMEHISGDDLAKRLEINDKPFPLNWVLFWADQLLDALHYLHSHNPPIIHRDIKPQNLKLTDENHIVLLDFGLAKDSVGQTRVTTAGSVVGYTPHYAPMEQIRGSGTNPKSDIYSLSATLYQLVTNTVPIDALSRADSMLGGLPDPVAPISELNPEVPKPISDIIMKGMAISQEQRHSTAREMQKALRDSYARLQSAMSAQTMVFSNEELGQAIPPADEKTSQFATHPSEPLNSQQPILHKQPSKHSADSRTSQPTEQMNFPPVQQNEPNFDETLRYDSVPTEISQKQSDIKTQVITTDDAQLDSQPSSNHTVSNFDSIPPVGEAYQSPSNTEAFSVGETYVPAREIEYQDDEYSENQYDNYEGEQVQYEQAEEVYEETGDERSTAFAAPPASNGSNSRTILLVGGLFAVLVLVVGAAGAGWFVYNNYLDKPVVAENPPPTPQPTATAIPTPAETPQILTTADVTNTNSEVSSTGNTNTVETDLPLTEITETREKTKPSEPAKPTPTRAATPRNTPQVVTAKTPKPTPQVVTTPKKDPGTKGRSTDILQ